MRGDAAVKEYTAKFDRVELSSVCVPIDVRTSWPFSLRIKLIIWRAVILQLSLNFPSALHHACFSEVNTLSLETRSARCRTCQIQSWTPRHRRRSTRRTIISGPFTRRSRAPPWRSRPCRVSAAGGSRAP